MNQEKELHRFQSANKFLIWGIAIGQRSQELAFYWLNSILSVGNWRHDIVLLGDKNIVSLNSERLRTINILDDVVKQWNLPYEQWSRWTCNNLKSQIVRYIDVKQYQYILYLDSDIIANTNRLESLVEEKFKRQVVSVQRDCIPLPRPRFRALKKLGTPNALEQSEWARRPICAGMMGFPVNSIGLAVLRDYHEACLAMHFKWSDQAKLVALLNRKYEGYWEFLDDAAFGTRIRPPYTETLVHFTGLHRGLMETYCNTHHEVFRSPSTHERKQKWSLHFQL